MKLLAAFAAAVSLGLVAPAQAAADNTLQRRADEPAKSKLPDLLTADTFDTVTGRELTFVEFFSPYCGHCKSLAPIWEEAFFLTEEEQITNKIHMRQVDCVESGDLCSRESIEYYPNLRLYAPDEKNTGGRPSRFVDTFPGTLERTTENFRKYMRTAVAQHNSDLLSMPSVSQPMTIDLGLRVVAGEASEPYFVALFSSKDEEFESGEFPGSCLDCMTHRQNWDRLSNVIATEVKTAHLNCHTHPTLCDKLGFKHLARDSKRLAPRYIMFVPKKAGMIRFDYTGALSLAEMKGFALKLAANHRYDELTWRGLEDMGFLKTELPLEPQDLYYPISNKMSLVFSFDIETVTPEDRAILPYLLETVTKLPFEIALYTTNGIKLEQLLEEQSKALTHYANSDATFEDIPYSRKLHIITSMTAKPTLYMFKENSLIPAVYQNFAIEDMRDADKIENFVKANSFPLYGELTPQNYKNYFFNKGSKNDQNSKVVITFLDTDDATAIKNTLYDLSLVAHQYHLEKNMFYHDKLLKHRDNKIKKTAEMKANGVETPDIIEAMREHVPHLFDHNQVLFTYVDMVLYPEFAKEFGLNIDGRDYKSGDTLVVSKAQKFYWDTDLEGAHLTTDRKALRNTLKYLLNPALVPGLSNKFNLPSKLVGSPFHKRLRHADIIHQHGFWGYVLFILVLITVYQMTRFLASRPSHKRMGGIIGNFSSKSD